MNIKPKLQGQHCEAPINFGIVSLKAIQRDLWNMLLYKIVFYIHFLQPKGMIRCLGFNYYENVAHFIQVKLRSDQRKVEEGREKKGY